jgi:thiol:disulfide interchange protein/DsbC/DsbD-like thiol-disulfide interchange protein
MMKTGLGRYLVLTLVTIFSALSGALVRDAHAGAPPVDAGYAVAEIVTERQVIVPGDVFLGALRLTIDPNWHVYWINAGDSGLAPEIRWVDQQGFEFGAFRFPAPYEMPLEGLMNYGYKDELILPFEIRVPADLPTDGLVRLTANAGWLICEDICIPEEAELFLTLELGESPVEDAAGMDVIARALSQIPVELAGTASYQTQDGVYLLDISAPALALAAKTAANARFYPYGHEILHPAPQSPQWGPAGVRLTLTAAPGFAIPEEGLKGVLVLDPTEPDGIRAAYEIIARLGPAQEGVSGLPFAAAANKGSGGGSGLALGMLGWMTLIGSALLGGLILNLMPCVLPVLSIKAVGLTQAAAHDAAMLRHHGLAYAAGVVLSFIVLAGLLVALRAAGEQVGVGFQLQQPALVAVLALVMFVVGLNLLGVFEIGSAFAGAGQGLTEKPGAAGAFFTGVLAAVVGAPCIGPFLGAAAGVAVTQPAPIVLALFGLIGLGMSLPFLVLSFVPALARRIPRPGAWMNTFKQAMAFPMFGAALWLLWVLAGQTEGSGAVLALIAGMLLIGFAFWLVGISKGRLARVVGAAVLLVGLAAPVAFAARDLGSGPVPDVLVTAEVEGFEAGVWSPEAVAEARAAGKGVFVDFTARWCVTCQVNKRTTLSRPDVQAAMAEANVVFLEADWTNRDDAIAKELALHGRAGVPLYLFYAPGTAGEEPVILPQVLSPAFVIERVSAKS